jgi:hypothetical protein
MLDQADSRASCISAALVARHHCRATSFVGAQADGLLGNLEYLAPATTGSCLDGVSLVTALNVDLRINHPRWHNPWRRFEYL